VENANSKIENTNKEVSVDNYCAECFENYNFILNRNQIGFNVRCVECGCMKLVQHSKTIARDVAS